MKTRFFIACAGALVLCAALALLHLGAPAAQAVITDTGLSAVAPAPGVTIVSSNITTHTTWTKAGSPYSVTQYVRVQAGIMLTVEPGVEVQFPYAGLGVQGTLLAIGSPSEPITFTSSTKQPGSWMGVDVTTGATATLRYVTMEYGRNYGLPNDGMLDANGATVSVSQSVFRFGGSNGIASDLGLNSNVQVSATTFISNGRSALRFSAVPPTAHDPVLRDLTASGNGLNAVEYHGVNLIGPHLWEYTGLPYATSGGLTVNYTGSLTLEPGVEVQSDSLFSVLGTLSALGTPTQPITFTGISKTPGAWWGISVQSIAPLTGTIFLRNVTVEYGGGSGAYPSNFTIGTGTVVSVTQSVIRNGSRNGVMFSGSGGTVGLSGLSLTGNAGYPIYLSGATNPALHDITASGNLTQAIGIRPFFTWYNGDYVLQNVGLPYFLDGSDSVSFGSSLTIDPGVELSMGSGANLYIDGSLYAVGTPALPITITGRFTGTTPTPGWWRNVTFSGNARAILRYCDIGYGGAAASAMLTISTNRVILQDCRIHHSAAEAITAVPLAGGRTSKPFIVNNRIEQNAFGLRNLDTLYDYVDATNNWWGAPSGPYHATNPNGLGNAVSDHVLFQPWLLSPPGPSSELEAQLSGPNKFAPGRIEEYAIRYTNNTTQTVQDAVLMVAMPSFADYLDDSGGGVLWPQRRQLFWKLGNLAPGTTGLLSFRVRFFWGLPIGLKDTAVAELGGTNISMPGFNVQSYLDYVATTIVSDQPLTWTEVQAERQAHPEFDQLFNQAIQEGYTGTVASRLTLSAGEPLTEVILLRFTPEFGATFVQRQGTHAQATIISESSYLVRTSAGTLSFNFQTDEWEILPVSAAFADPSPQTAGITFGECMKNCILEKVPKYIVKNVFKSVSVISKAIDCYKAATTNDPLDIAKCAQIIKKIPGVSEGIDLGKCNSDCQQNPSSHVCTKDLRYCDTGGFPYGIFGVHSIEECKCVTDPATGREGTYLACTTTQVCALCEKCVETDSGPQCTVPTPTDSGSGIGMPMQLSGISGGSDETCAECIRAKDPNAKYGPGGDVLSGQLMTYTITFENEGAGTAYDVFVVDELPAELDESTMVLYGGGDYVAAGRSIIWWVGQLAAKGQPGSTGVVSFTVRLKANLANGTAVVNRAVVHFPSVPEVTPTNPVVNIVQPLAAIPQGLETISGQPVAITLQGRNPSGAPLVYTMVEAPLNGTLSGTPPNLLYTPAGNFTGIDRLRFTIADGITTSRPADVDILVHPSPSDTTPPQVIRTDPGNGGLIAQIIDTPHFTDTVGPLYLPGIEIGFSEAISDTTVTTDTIRATDSHGSSVPIRVGYDGSVNKAIVLFREPLKPGTQYTFTVTTGIRDLNGNALPANYAWSIRTAGTGGNAVYLPLIMR